MTNGTHLTLVRLDATPAVAPPEKPRWPPLIAPTPAPGPDDDEYDAEDEEDVRLVLSKKYDRQLQYRVSSYEGKVDSLHGAVLLHKALAELGSIRRRYALIEALAPVFAAVDQLLTDAAEPDVSRLAAAVFHARLMIEREGYDMRGAAERSAELHGAKVFDVLEELRARAAV